MSTVQLCSDSSGQLVLHVCCSCRSADAAIAASLMAGFGPSNHSVLDNTTSQNVSSVDICSGAGTYSDGTCKTVWPFWVEVTVPLCCIVIFLLTLFVVYLRPVGSTDKNDTCKQQLKADDAERTEGDNTVSCRQADEASLDTKV